LTAAALTARPGGDGEQVQAQWQAAFGAQPVLLVRNVARARSLLLRSRLCTEQAQLILPANATPALVQSVTRTQQPISFAELDSSLALSGADMGVVWAQPGGVVAAAAGRAPGRALVIDYGECAPAPGAGLQGDVAIYRLFAAQEAREAGALLLFGDRRLFRHVQSLMQPEDTPAHGALAAHLPVWEALVQRQQTVLAAIAAGVREAAGLVVVMPANVLADAVLVQIPEEAPASAFYAYASAENTPVQWMPLVRPVHHAALRSGRGAATQRNLARWLALPAAPGYDEEQVRHTVLGIVKTAEYLGVRWRTDPLRAAAYAALMDEMYGAGHDAYRPNFPTAPVAAEDVAALSAMAQAIACTLSPNGGTNGND
jgi:predicted transcriptional regulator